MHVLIVEDDRVIAENLYDFLETCGHRCDFAPSLASAEALLTRNEFDALVLLQALEAGARLDLAEVREQVLAAVIGLDETEALLGVEPFDSACRHFDVLN